MQKEKLALRDEIIRLKGEREQVALRMDAIRIKHEADSKESTVSAASLNFSFTPLLVLTFAIIIIVSPQCLSAHV